jgi:hypothetical protein
MLKHKVQFFNTVIIPVKGNPVKFKVPSHLLKLPIRTVKRMLKLTKQRPSLPSFEIIK